MKKYYQEHRDKILQRKKETYDTAKNTRKCRKYRKTHLESRKEYERNYYLEHRERIKERARKRYYEKISGENIG